MLSSSLGEVVQERAAEVHDDPGSVSMGLQGPLSQAEFQWITNTYKCIICGKGQTAAIQFWEIVQEHLYLACFPHLGISLACMQPLVIDACTLILQLPLQFDQWAEHNLVCLCPSEERSMCFCAVCWHLWCSTV